MRLYIFLAYLLYLALIREPMNEKTVVLDQLGPVTISKNKLARRIKITVKPGREIRVTIPEGASFHSGEIFLSEKRQWIEKTLDKLARKPSASRLILPGNLFSTRNYRYEVVPSSVEKIRIKYSGKEKLICFEYPKEMPVESPDIQKSLKRLVEGALRFEAKRFLPVRTAELAAKLGYQINRVSVKNNKTNWGSCSNLKNINLNLHLMRLPDRMIDFIIVHELVHTVIPNHGVKFKASMRNYFPDSALLEKEMKKIRPECLIHPD
jgi:predicted metal-dependent hydrolase